MTAATKPSVAYFCMEYGVSPELPIYSGGLGVLAGDTMKSVGDLHLPVVGVGILWNEGYTTQLIDQDGQPEDHYERTPREALTPVEAELEVTVRDKRVPLRAFKVNRYLSSTLYLLEPSQPDDQWITRRLYGGGDEDRLAQEIVLGVGGVRLLRALGVEVDLYHFNEGHAVFAGLELVREARGRGLGFDEAVAEVRRHIVFTTHTPVAAGNESHDLGAVKRTGAGLDFTDEELTGLAGSPFSMTVAGLRLAHRANAVAKLHGETANRMWSDVDGRAPIVAITNGVHVPTWQDARIRAAIVADKSEEERRRQLWAAHQELKGELVAAIAGLTGTELDPDRLLIGFARRATAYKRADLIFGDPSRLEPLFAEGKLQLVFSGKAHPKDQGGKALVHRLVEASRRWPKSVVFLENYNMTLGALLTRGCDVWLNNPRRPMEASGTSGMKAAMNGCLNASILDGWWPEGCRHGETGWQIGDAAGDALDGNTAEQDERDRQALYKCVSREVVPTYYDAHDHWVQMMLNSIHMSQWQFSSDRMVEDYYRVLYAPES
jgi:starch phosphorylase